MANPPDQSLDDALIVYIAALPRQARLLNLAGQVLRLLEEVRAGLPPLPEANLEEASSRLAAGDSLCTTISIPAPVFQDVFDRLAALMAKFELLPPLPSELLEKLRLLPPDYWLAEPEKVAALCSPAAAPSGLILLLGLKAMSPFYQQAAAPFLPLFLQGGWPESTCPICGQAPSLASLRSDSGQRLLYCGLCAAKWPVARHACVFCGHQGPQFSYIFVEDDPARRADLCPICHRYLKTIISTRMPHLTFLPLEEFITVDLDIVMARKDLES